MLVDAFMFYNELDVLELRLEVLDRFVDKFILVESEVTHAGGSKDLIFEKNKERFAKWLPKIQHIIVRAADAPKDPNPWSREKHQRDCVLNGLANVPDDAMIMISDVDEIPNLELVRFEQLPHLTCSVHMWMFEYSFRHLFTGEPWFGTVITNVQNFKKFGPNYFRDNRWKFPAFQFAGWHLTSFGDAAHVANKHRTFAHANDPREFPMTKETFEFWLDQGIHTDGKTKLIDTPPEVPLPGSNEVRRRLRMGAAP